MEEQLQTLVDKLEAQNRLNREEWIQLIEGRTPKLAQYIFEKARKIRQAYYGTDVYIRGLIEEKSGRLIMALMYISEG